MIIEDFKISLALQNYFKQLTDDSRITFRLLSEHTRKRIISSMHDSSFIKDSLVNEEHFYTFVIFDDGVVHVSKDTLSQLDYRVVISVYCSEQDVDSIKQQLSSAFTQGKQTFIDTVNSISGQYVLWLQSVGIPFKEYDFSNILEFSEMVEYMTSFAPTEKVIRASLDYITKLSMQQMKEKCVFQKFLIYSKINILREFVGILLEKNE